MRCPCCGGHAAAQENAKYTILLTGASFASPQNGWFEIGCRQLEARALNRAVGGESIADTANRMAEGTLWNAGELDALDALVIMQVHNRDVSATGGLKEKYTDYTTPFDRSNYAAAFDYVIKRYFSECYALKDDPKSKYYGTKSGKPAVIVLCTDWHDARTTITPPYGASPHGGAFRSWSSTRTSASRKTPRTRPPEPSRVCSTPRTRRPSKG